MKRDEFIGRLRSGLNRLPEEELNDALNYYNEIFLDAGLENEEKTAEKLGDIDEIIRQIYFENGIDPDGKPEFIMDSVIDNRGEYENSDSRYYGENKRGENYGGGISLIAKILLLIVLFPVWFPLMIVAFVLAFVFGILGIVLEAVLGIVGLSCALTGILTAFTAPPYGFIMAGAGLIMLGIFSITASCVFKSLWQGGVRNLNRVVLKLHGILFGRRSDYE